MPTSETVVNRIKYYCQQRGITLNKLAKISGVTQSTLNDIISGKTTTPTIETLDKVCKGLGISLKEFFNDDTFS